MRIESVSVNLLIPTQRIVFADKIDRFLREFEQKLWKPVSVVEYKSDSGLYLMGDGHHRACCAYLRQNPLLVQILETDEEVLLCDKGVFQYMESRRQFIEKYECLWKHNGVKSIEELLNRSI